MKSLLHFLLCFVLLCASSTSGETREKSISIGLITDLTGIGAYTGQQTVHGAKLAQNELAAQGINLTLIVEDHRMLTTAAISAASKLITLDHADAIFSQFSGPSVAASPLVRQAGRLFAYSAGAVSILKENPYALKTFLDFSDGCQRTAALWRKQGITKIGVLGPIHEAIELCRAGAFKEFPDLSLKHVESGSDASTQMLQLRNQGVEAILNPGYQTDVEAMLRGAALLHYSPSFGISQESYAADWMHRFPALMKKTFLFGLPSPPESFRTALLKLFPQSSAVGMEHAMLSYLMIKQLVRVLASCPEEDRDCQLQGMLASPTLPEFGFQGWRDRKAQFEVRVSQ